jgi:hypothetical protein
MKKLSLFLSIMAFVCIVFSQKIDKSQVPEPVKKMFEVKINDSIVPAWEKAGEDFRALFTKRNLSGEMFITGKAEWQKTVWIIPIQNIPQRIKDHIYTLNPKYKVVKSSIQYRTDGDFYVIETKNKKIPETLIYNVKCEFVKVDAQGDENSNKDKEKEKKE